ncbi:MAG: hypothetical protein ACOYYJ_15480 [Chloroflexota bacterium]
MSVQPLPNAKYIKGVRWLAELYEKKQVSNLTAQTLNKAVEYEISQVQAQLSEIEVVLAGYEKQFGIPTAKFIERYQQGQTDDSAETVEWASLAQMANGIRERLALLREHAE